MSVTWRTVCVFISSTFRGHARGAGPSGHRRLPGVARTGRAVGLEFFDVDLRWGVPARDANGETANSWEYCRQWIDRVEPFFVGIVGQRCFPRARGDF